MLNFGPKPYEILYQQWLDDPENLDLWSAYLDAKADWDDSI